MSTKAVVYEYGSERVLLDAYDYARSHTDIRIEMRKTQYNDFFLVFYASSGSAYSIVNAFAEQSGHFYKSKSDMYVEDVHAESTLIQPKSPRHQRPTEREKGKLAPTEEPKKSFWRQIFGGARPGLGVKVATSPQVDAKVGQKCTKADLIAAINLPGASPETMAKSGRFTIEVVKELVLECFYWNNDLHSSVPMKIGIAMDGAVFANWLAENIVIGRTPSQMMDDHHKFGSFGMWQDAVKLCESFGLSFK